MMKRNRLITNIIIACALLASIGTTSYAETGTIKGSAIRLRKEANTDSTIIDTYGDGEKVEILDKDGEWYKVTINKNTGYVYQDYIIVETDTNNSDDKKEENESTQQEKKKQEEKTEKNEEAKNETIKLGKIKVVTTQKIYILPNIGSSIIGEAKKDSDIDIIQEVNGWAYISTDSMYGWARYEKIANEAETEKISTYEEERKEEKIDIEEKKTTETEKKDNSEDKTETTGEVSVSEKKAYVSGTSVNFREKANTSATIIKSLSLNTEVTIIAENGDWYKVKVDGDTGYVSKKYISDSKTKETTSRASTEREVETTSSSDVTGDDIVKYAKKYLGYKYVYGEESPSTGFDCSGLVWYVYKHFGYNVSRSSVALANDGKTISNKSDLQPGDILIFLAYNDYSRVGHVGIYIGNNEFIHANDEKTGVIITSLDYGKYPERFVSGRRIID